MKARFQLVRELSCTPQALWPLLTDPEQMNRWSTAPITVADNGIGDRPDGTGALRTVTLPGRGKARLHEVIEWSEFPGRLVYRVHDGGPLLLDHRGEQQLTALPEGRCRLTWTVELSLLSSVASRVAARTIGRQVGESLDALARIVVDAPAPQPDSIPPTDAPVRTGPEETASLLAAAEESLAAQRATADRLAAAGDNKQWFARVYQYVTEEMMRTARTGGELANPDWVLALIPVFHDYFARNLTAFESGDECEPAWQRAWALCESTDDRRPSRPVVGGLLAGVSAHIDADLPRALSEVHVRRYPGRDLRAFRPDYLRLAPVFSAASDRLLAELPRRFQPWWTPLAGRVHPRVRDELLARRGYHVGRHRLRAFAAACELVDARSAH